MFGDMVFRYDARLNATTWIDLNGIKYLILWEHNHSHLCGEVFKKTFTSSWSSVGSKAF